MSKKSSKKPAAPKGEKAKAAAPDDGSVATVDAGSRKIGEIIYKARLAADLTQDEYGSKYSVSGPAVFKFEKGYVRPSLELWLAMAKDAGIAERRAVVLWVKSKLPSKFQGYVQDVFDGVAPSKKGEAVDYSKLGSMQEMQTAAAADNSLPKGLKEILGDAEIWALYRPTGTEINSLRDVFGANYGHGTANTYREALRLLREFNRA